MENSVEVSQKTELAYNPSIPLLGVYLKKMKTLIWKDMHRVLRYLRYPIMEAIQMPINRWMDKMWCDVCVCVCVCKPGSSGGSVIKNPPANAGDSGDAGSIPG